MLAGLIGTVRMALAFARLTGCEGLATVAKELKRGEDDSRFPSRRLQLTHASLARSIGCEVRLEPTLGKGVSKADLEISSDHASVTIEAFALLRDQQTINASAWLEVAREGLRSLGEDLRLDFLGKIVSPLGNAETAAWLKEVETYARLRAQGVDLPSLTFLGISLTAAPAEGRGGASRFEMPAVSLHERIRRRLQQKIAQTERSGANWLLIDSFDNLWHLTGWAELPLAQKAQQLSELLSNELASATHIRGVTISDGAALMRPDAPEQTIKSDGFIAMTRRSDGWHVRESVVVPLRENAEPSVGLWRTILDAESGWVGRELRRHGLMHPPELGGARPPFRTSS